MGKKKNKQLKKQLQGSIPAGMTVEELLASAAGGKKARGYSVRYKTIPVISFYLVHYLAQRLLMC